MKQKVSLAGISIINFLFAYKYFLRYSEHTLILTLLYLIITLGIVAFLTRYDFIWKYNSWLYWGIAFLYCACFIIAYRHIDPLKLKPDRWSIITNFWQAAFNGNYPYAAKSHMGNYPGPMPMYFVLALPFVWLKEIGYFSLLGFAGLAFFFRKKFNSKDSFIALYILISSIAVFWEILVRSTILVNSVLFLFWVNWLVGYKFNEKWKFWISAITAGCLLSTRSVFFLSMTVPLIFILKSNKILFKPIVLWGTIVLVIFGLTFLPFIILYPVDFFRINPFIVQSENILPAAFGIVFIAIAILAGLICSNKKDIIFYCGIVYLMFFFIYAGYNINKYGYHYSYIDSKTDISYVLFSLPFLLYSFSQRKTKDADCKK